MAVDPDGRLAQDRSVVSEFDEQLNDQVNGTVYVETSSLVASHLEAAGIKNGVDSVGSDIYTISASDPSPKHEHE